MTTTETPDTATKRVLVTMTMHMLVDLPVEEAESVIKEDDITVLSEHVTRWRRISGYGQEHQYGDLTVEDAAGDWLSESSWWGPVPVNGSDPEHYLWSARHFVCEARYQLSSGRYREGNCPDLDQVNGALARLEDELRLMALEIDRPEMPEVKAWRERQTERAEGERP